ncbi:hypothetical protein CKAN_02003400 [Cinnamomum micranthum f. kanehirae]|uniref:PB1 domain-containing protein n=1 Tax=Cinnamomum micranthum f. kanehirae TaxID=337451 RepID=A0A3S3PHT8_9MAGN|nr:hypothetical protein CKAN_02003400 [Cinnamomum micranthum f. kanehirae]
MLDSEVLFIFHYDGNFEFDMIRPVYNGGKQKIRYLLMDITYASLVNEANEAANCGPSIQNLNLQYLHHNGRAFSLAGIDDDNDVRRMLKASENDLNDIYLYVFNCQNDGQHNGGEQRRFQGIDKDRTCLKRNEERVKCFKGERGHGAISIS